MEETISLKEIMDVVKKRFLLIVSFTLGIALIAAVVSFFVLTPIYQSSTQFIVNQAQQEGEVDINTGTIRTNIELINTYNEIIENSIILDEVIKQLNLDTSVGSLASKISVSNVQNSQVVSVTVKHPDPVLATEISNTTVEVFQEKIVDIMNVDNVSILSKAVTADNPKPVDPNPKLNIAIGLVLGAMVGIGIAFLLEYLDTNIRTEEDVEKKLGITLIGVVSTMSAEDVRANHSLQEQRAQKRSER